MLPACLLFIFAVFCHVSEKKMSLLHVTYLDTHPLLQVYSTNVYNLVYFQYLMNLNLFYIIYMSIWSWSCIIFSSVQHKMEKSCNYLLILLRVVLKGAIWPTNSNASVITCHTNSNQLSKNLLSLKASFIKFKFRFLNVRSILTFNTFNVNVHLHLCPCVFHSPVNKYP